MRLNPVYLFFGLLLIYLIARVIAWTGQTSVAIYTVPAAVETAGRTDYRGLIVRDEQSVTAEASGTVEYLAPENEKTAVGQEVCLIDTDGSVASLLSDDSAEAISGAASAEIRKRIRAAGQEALSGDFASAAGEVEPLHALVVNSEMRSAVLAVRNSDSMPESAQICTAEESGYVMYASDSLSGLTEEQVTADSFDEDAVTGTYSWSGKSVESGDFLWRRVPDDSFTLVFETAGTDAAGWNDSQKVTVTLSGQESPVTGTFRQITGADGTALGCIDLSSCGTGVLTERFLSFHVDSASQQGYQIPRSAVTTKSYYVIPASYVDTSSGSPVITIERAEGNLTAKISVYSEYTGTNGDRTLYYLAACSSLNDGDYLVNGSSSGRYLVGVKAPVTGVYQVNRGYCIFRQVEIVREDEDYCFIASGTRYGITMNDRIVMDASGVKENQIL